MKKPIKKTVKPRHKHKFVTVQSFGAWGHIGKCSCGKTAEFVARD